MWESFAEDIILPGSPLLQFEVEPGTVSLQGSSEKVVDSDETNTDNRAENIKKQQGA